MNAAPDHISQQVHAVLDRMAGDLPALGIAVSGGGDSVALMHLLADWAQGRRIAVATVDHALRPESRAEADAVAALAAALDLPHDILTWQHGGAITGNVMAKARAARQDLLAQWAGRNDLPVIALGHTADDQAETLAMRLNRGAGIDGLASMPVLRQSHHIHWLRPMLGITRRDLREWLSLRRIRWIDDPSNDNSDYERVRIRTALQDSAWQITALADSAAHLQDARAALAHYAWQSCAGGSFENGRIDLPLAPFLAAPSEIRRRVLVAASRWITGQPYPPRRGTVMHALAAVSEGRRATLDGALLHPRSTSLRILREPAAAARARTGWDTWDNRWRISGLQKGQIVASPSAANLAELNRRDSGLSHEEALASPAIFADGRLVAAPLLQPQAPYRASPLRTATDFRRLVLAH